MSSRARAYAYLRQGPHIAMTPRQRRRFNRKLRIEQTHIMAAS